MQADSYFLISRTPKWKRCSIFCCSNQELSFTILEPITGIEPVSMLYESIVLPMN